MGSIVDFRINLPDAELPMLTIETEVRIVETTHQLSYERKFNVKINKHILN